LGFGVWGLGFRGWGLGVSPVAFMIVTSVAATTSPGAGGFASDAFGHRSSICCCSS